MNFPEHKNNKHDSDETQEKFDNLVNAAKDLYRELRNVVDTQGTKAGIDALKTMDPTSSAWLTMIFMEKIAQLEQEIRNLKKGGL